MILEKNFDTHSSDNDTFSVKNIKVFLHQIDKTKTAEFLLKNFNTASDPSKWKEEDCNTLDRLTKLWYHTKKQKIEETRVKSLL